MSKIQVVLPGGTFVTASSNSHTENQLAEIIIKRQKIAADYCRSKGWPESAEFLTWEQILEIRETKDWIDAGV